MAEHVVKAPLPGVFYRKSAPDQPPYVEVGGAVAADDTIGLIEVMKTFVQVKAAASGVLTAFMVENDAVVGAGDAIATVEVE